VPNESKEAAKSERKGFFMSRLINLRIAKLGLFGLLCLTACKQAGYQVLRPGTQTPQDFDGSSTIPPTARLEVIDQGVSVTWTYVGKQVEVKPSADTVDPDYLGKSNCENQGIIEATYDLANGSKPVVARTDCAKLSTAVTYDQPGDYLITMQVKSQDQEIAWASMTLKVVAKGTARDQIQGGFTIHAKPILTNVGTVVTFNAVCELEGQQTVQWDFADGGKAEGVVTTHTYANPGQYRISAVCKNEQGISMQASLTIVIMREGAPQIGDTSGPNPGSNPNIPSTPCTPTKGPCQSQNKSQTGSTSGKTVWYYYPSCYCYYQNYRYYYYYR